MKSIVTFNNVLKKYGHKVALDNLSFEVARGSSTALIGNNGCGKTTTINVMCNIIHYDGGEVFFDGTLVEQSYVSYKKKLGIILSHPYFIEDFDILTYWKFVARFQEIPKEDIKERISGLLELLELEDQKTQKIKTLSSGNQMKVTIGSSLIHNPEMLVLDEPFINLDVNTAQKIVALLKTFKGKKTIFITSHNLDLVIDTCDNFLIMDSGKIVESLQKDNFHDKKELRDYVVSLLAKDTKKQQINWLTS
jgi:ABC-2 type transport system ATP-binding protein